MNSINLDDRRIFEQYDPQGMRSRIRELPEQCRNAWQVIGDFELPADYKNIDQIVVLGMGGSAIGGDLVRTLTQYESSVTVIIHRDYGLPAYVNDRTLLIASSYSGNTEEVLSAFEPALETGAKKLAITTGGKLGMLSEASNIPAYRYDYPSQPRAALGYGFIPVLGVLQKLGFISDKSDQIQEAVEVMENLVAEYDIEQPLASNPAKLLAQRLQGKLNIIYGAGILAEVAHRWKTQINENSKAWAFHEVFPELNHNATVGFPFPTEIKDQLTVLMLRSPMFSQRIKMRCEVTAELLDKAGIVHEYLDSVGESPVCQMMSLIILGDFASYYLGILNGVDPTPVEVIDYLKNRLSQE